MHEDKDVWEDKRMNTKELEAKNKIQETMIEIMAEMEPNEDGLYWWNPFKLIKHANGCNLWIISGERRVGKTYFMQKLMFRLWEKYHWSSGWIRNQKNEYDNPIFRSSFMDTPIKEGWVNEEWVMDQDGLRAPPEPYEDENGEMRMPKKGPVVIKFFSLSTASNTRGGSHLDTHFLFMDEIEREDGKIIRNAKTALLSLSKTVLSGKPDTMICLASNAIHLTNPMYMGFKIFPGAMDVTRYPDKGIAIEAVRKGKYHTASGEDDPLYKVYKAGKYGDYAYVDEADIATLIKKVPKGAKIGSYGFKVDGEYYMYWIANGLMYFGSFDPRNLPRDSVFMTDDVTAVDAHTEKIWPFVLKDLKTVIGSGKARFTDANVMMAIVALTFGVQV